jgi:hypothetical protein
MPLAEDFQKVTELSEVDWDNQAVLASSTFQDDEAAPAATESQYAVPRTFIADNLSAVHAMLTAHDMDDSEKETPLVLDGVDAATLDAIIVFLKAHARARMRRIPAPLRTPWTDAVDEADQQYVAQLITAGGPEASPTRMAHFFRVMNAGIFVGCDDLVALLASYLASQVVDKSAKQLRGLLNVQDRHPPEVEAAMAKDFATFFPDKARLFEL